MAPTPKRILVPTDFSPASDSALGFAGELAGPFEAEIHLLHVRTVVEDPVVSPEDLEEIDRILAMSDAESQKALEKSAEGTGVPTEEGVRQRAVVPGEAEGRARARSPGDTPAGPGARAPGPSP